MRPNDWSASWLNAAGDRSISSRAQPTHRSTTVTVVEAPWTAPQPWSATLLEVNELTKLTVDCRCASAHGVATNKLSEPCNINQ